MFLNLAPAPQRNVDFHSPTFLSADPTVRGFAASNARGDRMITMGRTADSTTVFNQSVS